MLVSISLFAQHKMDPKMIEEFKSKKISFITEKVGLTPQEAEKFWPIYNKLDKERFDLMDRRRQLEDIGENSASKSADEYRSIANEIASLHGKEGRLVEEYNVKFLSILSAEKVVKLYNSEGEFRSYIMKEFRKGLNEAPSRK